MVIIMAARAVFDVVPSQRDHKDLGEPLRVVPDYTKG